MKEVITRPILFNSEMVRAILEGRKTVTRRIMKPQPTCTDMWCNWGDEWATAEAAEDSEVVDEWRCPYGQSGDRLWVRETICIAPRQWAPPGQCISDDDGYWHLVKYRATDPNEDAIRDYKLKWTPSIFMPRWASRITLEITEIRVERVQDITPEDAMHEGVPYTELNNFRPDELHRAQFADLWDSINEKRGYSWDSNSWVWVVKFKKVIDVQQA